MPKKEENKILSKLWEVCHRENFMESDYELLVDMYSYVSDANMADDQRDREIRRMIGEAFSGKESE